MTPRALLRVRSMVMGRGAEEVAEPAGDYLAAPKIEPREAAADSRRERWQKTLDMLVEDYLRFHVERYRGLRSLGSWEEAPRWRRVP